ncbi:hypothetical protein MRBBS_2194 [Marinobacter sp. BSs20148]|nr:hypothetical protein MRBBS_2194 [Marinobacter sp. BSs20148]
MAQAWHEQHLPVIDGVSQRFVRQGAPILQKYARSIHFKGIGGGATRSPHDSL